jgi:hypothetical protein
MDEALEKPEVAALDKPGAAPLDAALDKPGAAPLAAALDKLEVAETVSRFYWTLQRYHTEDVGFEDFRDVVDDHMAYLSPNFRDETPKPIDEWMDWFHAIQSVHAHGERGSFFSISVPMVTVDGDAAHLDAHIVSSHWLGPARGLSTWFFGQLDVDLRRTPEGWRIRRLETRSVREEGHEPAINYLTPNLETVGGGGTTTVGGGNE